MKINCAICKIHAHLVYYSCLYGKFMDVYSAVVSQADIVPLIQNFSNWNTENSIETYRKGSLCSAFSAVPYDHIPGIHMWQ